VCDGTRRRPLGPGPRDLRRGNPGEPSVASRSAASAPSSPTGRAAGQPTLGGSSRRPQALSVPRRRPDGGNRPARTTDSSPPPIRRRARPSFAPAPRTQPAARRDPRSSMGGGEPPSRTPSMTQAQLDRSSPCRPANRSPPYAASASRPIRPGCSNPRRSAWSSTAHPAAAPRCIPGGERRPSRPGRVPRSEMRFVLRFGPAIWREPTSPRFEPSPAPRSRRPGSSVPDVPCSNAGRRSLDPMITFSSRQVRPRGASTAALPRQQPPRAGPSIGGACRRSS